MRGSAWIAVALLAGLAACGNERDATEVSVPDPPQPIPLVSNAPGEPVRLVHRAAEGDVVRVLVRPVPLVGCGSEKLVLEGPDGTAIDLPTLDPVTRIEADGEWTWTFDPCPGDTKTYTLVATPTRQLPLETDGEPVTLSKHATYDDAATFVVPREGHVILLGKPTVVLDPNGARMVFQPGSSRVALHGAVQAGTHTVLGQGEFRVVRPTEITAELDSPVELEAPEGGLAGEYEVSFTVPEDTWLTAPLRGWAAGEGNIAIRSIEAADGSTDGVRDGGGLDGLWHLTKGSYIARVFPSTADDSGTLTLTRLTPTEITSPGEHTLSTGPDGEPGVALFDLPTTHPISVLEVRGGFVPWVLTWDNDAPPEPCVSALSCMAVQPQTIPSPVFVPSRIGGQGFLVLATGDGEQHTVTVRIG